MELAANETDLLIQIIKNSTIDNLCSALVTAYPKDTEKDINAKISVISEIVYKSDPKKYDRIRSDKLQYEVK